ncbi:aryl-sulfate sulfotransferase [bacterium]|nr:aryl-sulfate sulfotransferase [bacterium]
MINFNPDKTRSCLTPLATCLLFLISQTIVAGFKCDESPAMNTHNDRFTDPVVLNGVSVPADYPFINITVNENPDAGHIFFTTAWMPPHYSMILDNSGAPVWYRKFEDAHVDFKVQPDGRLTMTDLRNDQYIAMDQTYTVVDSFVVPRGYRPDEHELQVLPNGHYFLIARRDSIIDMSQLIEGGETKARVYGNSLVEMDADDKIVRMWSGWKHYHMFDAVHENFQNIIIDPVHMNAVAVDLDGHILVSCRAMNEITKFSRHTDEVIWRLGGANDYFTWPEGEDRINYQHDIRVLPDGNYTIFDNGNFRTPEYSRVIELSLDTENWSVTKVWEYRENPDIYTPYMGNTQRLPNGNTLICWSNWELPKLTEVRPDGSKAFEMDFVNATLRTYRTFRFPWNGKAAIPYLIIEPGAYCVTLLMNKFGDPDVAEYRIYGGTHPNPDHVITTTAKPFVHLTSELQNQNNYYFRVTAVNSQGQESGFSNEETLFVNMVSPGENMIMNGDFSDGLNSWTWQILSSVAANWDITNDGELHCNIHAGGSVATLIQIQSSNIQLRYGNTYLFEFDAYADQNREAEIAVKKKDPPFTKYSQTGLTWLTTEKTHFTDEFVMKSPSEFHANVRLDVGGSDHDVYFDNITVREIITAEAGQARPKFNDCTLMNNYPNPFNPATTICFSLPETSHIELKVYIITGQEVTTLVNKRMSAGVHQVIWNGKNDFGTLSPSGLYIYKLKAVNSVKTGKMILLR